MRGIYDFETWDWVNPLCCGILVDNDFIFLHVDRKHCHPPQGDKGQTLSWRVLVNMALLVKERGVKDFWAHNGGGFDALILMQEAIERGWVVMGIPANGRIIHMEIAVPLDGKEVIVTLKDSYAVVQASLEKAAKDFAVGMSKEFQDYDKDMRARSIPELISGVRTDCILVQRVLNTVESLLRRHGGALKSTFSSSALSVVKAKLKAKGSKLAEFSKETLWVNETSREAFYGGRVEVFHHCPEGEVTEYDVLSSYPKAMSGDMPWEYMCRVKRGSNAWEVQDGIGYFHVTVPNMEIPCLPFRDRDGGLFFPTGTWNGWYPFNEIRYAVSKCGVSAQLQDGYLFSTERGPFLDFVNEFYEEKQRAVGAVRTFDKLTLNGGYGKFAQRPEIETLRIFKTEEEGLDFVQRERVETRKIDGTYRCLGIKETRWSKHTHYPIASYITADARIRLHSFLVEAQKVAYGDTDSVHAYGAKSASLSSLCGTHLGALEQKGIYSRAEYYAAKLYRTQAKDGTWHHANKGFTIEEAAFEKVIRGEAVSQERMRKAKSQIRMGGKFAREKIMKLWKGKSMKRRPMKDGSTAPWSVDDLLAGEHKTAMSPIFRST